MPKKKISQEQIIYLSKEQVLLSKERTILSFMQTGLGFIGVGILVVNVFGANYQSFVIGWALILIGFVEVLESWRRLRIQRKKMGRIKTELKKLGVEDV